MMPMARFVAYYHVNNELVVDSTIMEVEEELPNHVSLYCALRDPVRARDLGCLLCPHIFQFHCACLRTEICLRELTLSRTLNPNPMSSRSVDPQFSRKLLFYVH